MEATMRRTFASLAVYNYRLYFVGQGLSLCGTWAQTIALSWLVLQLTHSGTQLGLVTAAQFLPVLLFGVWGGVVADRFDKRRIMYLTQTTLGLTALALGLIVVTGVTRLWMVYGIATIFGCALVVDSPARQTFIIEMVGADLLKNAITLNSILVNVARIVGPTLAGILIALVGVGPCFLFNAASYGCLVLALLAMRRHELKPTNRDRSASGQVIAGLQYAWRQTTLRSILLMMFIIGIFAYEFPVILPLLATKSFHGQASTYAAMTVAMGIGAVLGGLYTAGKARTSLRQLIVLAVLFGCSIILSALMPGLPEVLIMLVVVGILSVLFISIGNTTLQLTSEPHMRGRVWSLWSIAFQGTTPIGGPIIGYIADHSNPRVGLLVGGLATVLAALVGVMAAR